MIDRLGRINAMAAALQKRSAASGTLLHEIADLLTLIECCERGEGVLEIRTSTGSMFRNGVVLDAARTAAIKDMVDLAARERIAQIAEELRGAGIDISEALQ